MRKRLVCPPRYGYGLIEVGPCSDAEFPIAQAEARLGFLRERLAELGPRISALEAKYPPRPRRRWSIMVDLETTGTAPGCSPVSIGAVAFDQVAGELGPQFYAVIDRRSCALYGLREDPATLREFWAKQAPEVRAVLTDPTAVPLGVALDLFSRYWRDAGGVEIWSRGSNFDEPILEAAFTAAGRSSPWRFWNARCTRTIFAAAGVGPNRAKGVHHNALDDAVNQAEAVIEAYRVLGLGRRPLGWILQRAWRRIRGRA